MPDQSFKPHLEPTQEAGREFFSRNIQGPVVMLNLMRFRKIADYSDAPHLAPTATVSGEAAYKQYMDHTLPFLTKSGGKVLFYGSGGTYLVGPSDERWDAVMLVRQASLASFLAFASDQSYLLGIGHRTAALEDSRLLPLIEQ